VKRIALEALAIVLVAVVLGTAGHSLQPPKAKIPFVGDYKNPYLASPPPAPRPPPSEAAGAGAKPEAKTSSGTGVYSPPAAGSEAGAAGSPAGEGAAEPEKPPYVDPDGIIVEIDVAEASTEHEDGSTFLDARRTRFYLDGHIPGARAMSVWEGDFGDRFSQFLNEVEDLEQTYVVYCMSKNCEDSHMLAERMKGAGFKRIRVLRGGFPAWKDAGHAFETGPEKPRAGEEGK
jgi:rhodanese-related sulfurtransferase